MNEQPQYVVLADTSYYLGDYQYPDGWRLTVAQVCEEGSYTDCIGTLEECQEWLEELNDAPTYLANGQAGETYRIARVLCEDANYQSWLDCQDWEGCPSPDGEDYEANCRWAENAAYESNGELCVRSFDCLLLVDLGDTGA